MFGKTLENMTRYYHSEGSAVVGDNEEENNALWDVLEKATNGYVDGTYLGSIPIALCKWLNDPEIPPPVLGCESAAEAVEVADALNRLPTGKWVRGVFGMIRMNW